MQGLTAWISSPSLEELRGDADRFYPNETGGVLTGYWADDANVVITAVMGAGLAAVHKRYSYEHDHVWEAAQIGLEYERSGRTNVYVGDWHTHPDALSGRLSGTDKRALRRVLLSRDARLSKVLMLVLFGHPQEWRADVRVAEFRRVSAWRWRRSLSIESARLQRYD
ncbi:Mov34/MPN/PAD-1 family protein [Bradyrhizobium sp. 183]|uniref:Mov34/MPN/PAD-1 family protein n=1 Tax=unclassified Bradyrhizobium TaxID=2631580 RepID=UPI001FFFD744|nr:MULTISPECIES: Mov34/MPN/PAD-1 family protein [unclassified Bradyrhizobium]UPJ79130.1 Mov34/MPN/PAD-1 family protein [Bradyrhizobium sp. 184]UPJ86923.1 Mov34/MPN/PAD-1 family protein [Bradyrhizobium sp. 183]